MRWQQGMTIIEVLIAITIFAIITSAAIPAMQSLFGRKSIESISRSFNQSLQLARSEAIQRTTIVKVQPISNVSGWKGGWELVYTDDGGNDVIIRSLPLTTADAPDLVFISTDFSQASPLEILPSGQASTTGDFDLYYSGAGSDTGFNFEVQLSGLIKRTQTTGH